MVCRSLVRPFSLNQVSVLRRAGFHASSPSTPCIPCRDRSFSSASPSQRQQQPLQCLIVAYEYHHRSGTASHRATPEPPTIYEPSPRDRSFSSVPAGNPTIRPRCLTQATTRCTFCVEPPRSWSLCKMANPAVGSGEIAHQREEMRKMNAVPENVVCQNSIPTRTTAYHSGEIDGWPAALGQKEDAIGGFRSFCDRL